MKLPANWRPIALAIAAGAAAMIGLAFVLDEGAYLWAGVLIWVVVGGVIAAITRK